MVPSPAPPGSDSAEDMHETIEKPRNIASIGLRRLPAQLSSHRISLISQVPSSSDRPPDGGGGCVRPCHVVKAVEREHQRVIAAGRQLFGAALDDLDVAEPCLGDPRAGALGGQG